MAHLLLTLLLAAGSAAGLTPVPVAFPLLNQRVASVSAGGNMNIVTYAMGATLQPERRWVVSLYRGTLTHQTLLGAGPGATFTLQFLAPAHAALVPVLGAQSGRDADKRAECAAAGFAWERDESAPDGEGDDLLPGCPLYLRMTLLDWLPTGAADNDKCHDLCLCRVEATTSDAPESKFLTTDACRAAGLIP